MKRTNFILNGFLALAIVLVFAQCSDNNNAATSSTAPAVGVAGSSNMKIAYVEIDSLLTKYNFWNDLNEVMIQMKQQQELQALQQKLSDELASENQKNSLQLRDSINSFLKIYNQNKGYDLIISNTGFDNLLYANPAYNITQEIIDGLNARYTPSSVKK